MFHKMICFTFAAVLAAVSVPAFAFDLFGDSYYSAPKDGTVTSFEVRLVHRDNAGRVAILRREMGKGNRDVFKESMPDGRFYRDVNGNYYFLEQKIVLSTSSLKEAHYSLTRNAYIDGKGRTTYTFDHKLEVNLNRDATILFADFTRKNVNRNIAVFINGYLICVPSINGPVTDGHFTVSAGTAGRSMYKSR